MSIFAKKIQKRASTVGFDWNNSHDVLHKVEEEFNELKTELSKDNKQTKLEEELGDILFSIVNLSRHLKINAENALRKEAEAMKKLAEAGFQASANPTMWELY